jgi:glycosyltransferase involved in cell wall biosynthesis
MPGVELSEFMQRDKARDMAPSVSVVVPCYKSESTLPLLVAQLLPVLGRTCVEYEILLVVDGSPDDTWSVAADLAEDHGPVSALRMSRNYGQHNAILAGVREARFELIVTMDDDLQHRPEQVPALLSALTPNLDLVYGTPRREEHSFLRSLASRLVKAAIARGLGVPSATRISAFRAFRTRLRDGLSGMTGPHVSMDVALLWGTTRVDSLEVDMDPRTEGRSNYSFRMLVRHSLTMMLGYSTAPLRLVTYLGIFCGFLGSALLAYVLWQYAFGVTTVQGFTTIISVIAVFSGAQMIALGVVGEYLARVHINSIGQPSYLVSERRSNTRPVEVRPDLAEDPAARRGQ